MPQGSDTAWLYSAAEGRRQLAASANFRRLVVAAMHRNQEYADMQAVQAELSPMVMDLAPPGMPDNQQVHTHAHAHTLWKCWACPFEAPPLFRCPSCRSGATWAGGRRSAGE